MNPFSVLSNNVKTSKSHRKKKTSQKKLPPKIDRPDQFQNLLLALSQELTCPITGELFLRPVITPSGNTYEKSSLLKIGHDPISLQSFGGNLLSNRLAELLVERFGEDLRNLPDDLTAPRVPPVPKWLVDRRKIVDISICQPAISPLTFPYKAIGFTLLTTYCCFCFGVLIGKQFMN